MLKVTASTAHPGGLPYRADIDGLRAVAVLAVILHHAWPNWFVSGFIGVDVFFVISGYLITSIILMQLEAGKFSIADFYVRRIFPALVLVLFATLLFGWVVLLHGEFRQIGKHIAAGGGFVANLVFWSEAGYFDSSGTSKPLLHLWSLGVEEQFYLLWPLILWLAFKRHRNFLLIMAIIFCLSMAINVMTVESNPTAAFYSPVTRFWELMTGGIAAYLQLHRTAWTQRWRTVASVGGTALLVLGFTFVKPDVFFPGWWALLPAGGTFLIIMADAGQALNRYLLSNKAAVGIGLISYPLYLWHWPLLSYSHIIYGEKTPFQIKVALIASAFMLAYLTYRLIEVPLRQRRNHKHVVSGLGGAMLAMVLLGVLTAGGVLRERIDVHGAEIYLQALNDSAFPGPLFTPLRHQNIVFQKVSSQTKGLTVFLGDSVVQQYGPRIEQAIASDPARFNSVIFATAAGCPPILHAVKLPRFKFPLCPQATEAAYDLAGASDVDTVVIGAAWYGYFSPGNRELLFEKNASVLAFPSAQAMDASYESLRASIARLSGQGKRVFLILQPPTGPLFDPRNMYTGSRFGDIHPLPSIPNLNKQAFLEENGGVRARLIAIARHSGARIIEPLDYLCTGATCPVTDGSGIPAYTDPVHMRPAYSRKMATYLDQTMLPQEAKSRAALSTAVLSGSAR
ncbi:peptidoglycan/LPS O-acetylase OafA/YrhL [Janthinobacterium sp. 67]|nr:peptidoglycan/LPS O-acetylase OafA/YrhL [Janthinobacterium sp. 67]